MRRAWLIVARKEILDHLRDRRSLLPAVAYSLMGPAVVLLVSFSPKARTDSTAGVMLGMMSVFALVSAFTGGMHVATDVMSGERERRSLLPLLMTPVGRWDVVIGEESRDAQAAGDFERFAFAVCGGRFDRRSDPLGDFAGVDGVGGRQNRGKFFAAIATGNVHFARLFDQHFGDLP